MNLKNVSCACTSMSMTATTLAQRRADAKARLDSESDFVVIGGSVCFRQSFQAVEADETFCNAPESIVDAGKRLLELDIGNGISSLVHDTVVVRIGCNNVPLFAMVGGGRGHTLFSFKCVYMGCTAFMDIRVLRHADVIKWIVMGVSHNHDFSTFPNRVPRNTFDAETKAMINNMVVQNKPSAEIRLTTGALCNKHVFQNALRQARSDIRADQSRALREAASQSAIWSSEIHLTGENAFFEAFFVNSVLLTKRLRVTHVFMDDTSCTNEFSLPVVAILCRDDSDTVHCIAWGIVKNRTTDSFVRFLTFVTKYFKDIKTFVCDRHYAQQKAIIQVFGEHVNVLHCCVHIARNIQQNTGPKSDLLGLFWTMRFTRTEATERAFIDALERLHGAKRSMFTTQLLNSLDSFLPSRIQNALDIELFPEIIPLRELSLRSCVADNPMKERAATLLRHIVQAGHFHRDIFSRDNTNTIEGYFSTVKRRTPLKTSTLLVIFKAITFTEQSALSVNHPSSPRVPKPLVDCLLSVISQEVLCLMSSKGVHSFLNCLACSIKAILFDIPTIEDGPLSFVHKHLERGEVIDAFKWMPSEWVLSLDQPVTSHYVFVLDVDESVSPVNIMMRLESFLGNVNRSIDLFKSLNDALVTLYSLEGREECQNVMPVCYSFFNREFARYAELAQTNSEVALVLKELCNSLEAVTFQKENVTEPRRLSIVDPKAAKISGQRTTSTSSTVDHCAHVQRSKMVERFQRDVLDRKPRPTKTKKQHRCSICGQSGHHPQTCVHILDSEHEEGANLFLKLLVEKGKVQRYLDLVTKRATPEFVQGVKKRVKLLSVCSADEVSAESHKVDQ